MRNTIKPKIIHNKKVEKKFFDILSFSQNRFLSNRKRVFPLFLENGWTDQVEYFFMSSSAKLGCVFFFEMWFQKNSTAFTKFLLAEKNDF
jgi:hypothetical protein